MKDVNDILSILEGKSAPMLADQLKQYYKAMSGKLPKQVQAVVFILNKYPMINTREMILDIRDGRLDALKKIGVLSDDLKTLKTLLVKIGPNIKMLPQFLDERQRQALEFNKLNFDDIALDITTPEGRNETAKKYTPLLMKIVNQWFGKCPLDKAELISAGMVGLTNAMNLYDPMNAKDGKHLTFAQYAAYQIKYAILQDINKYSHTIDQSDYARKTYGDVMIQSIDAIGPDPDDTIDVDRVLKLSEEPEYTFDNNKERQYWDAVYKRLEDKFSARDCEIFYRSLGLKDHKKEAGKDIAASLGVTPGRISQTIRKFITFMTTDKDSYGLLANINDMYMESIVPRMIGCERSVIAEALVGDSIFMMLNEAMRWSDKDTFLDAVKRCIASSSKGEAVRESLIDPEYCDEYYRVNKQSIVEFLSNLYPTRSFSQADDHTILEEMAYLNSIALKHEITTNI